MAYYGNQEKYETLKAYSLTDGKIDDLAKLLKSMQEKGATDFQYTNTNGDPCGNYEFLRFYREIPAEEIKAKKKAELERQLRDLEGEG